MIVEIKGTGETVEFPDSMTPEQVSGVMRKKFPAAPAPQHAAEQMADTSAEMPWMPEAAPPSGKPGLVGDTLKAIPSAVQEVAHATTKTITDTPGAIGDLLTSYAIGQQPEASQAGLTERYAGIKRGRERSALGKAGADIRNTLLSLTAPDPELKPKRLPGQIGSEIGQFMVPFVPANKAVQASRVINKIGPAMRAASKNPKIAMALRRMLGNKAAQGAAQRMPAAAVAGAATASLALDPYKPNIANMAQELGADSKLIQWLAVSDTDPRAIAMLKAGIADAAIGIPADALVETVVPALRALKGNIWKAGRGDPKTVAGAIADAVGRNTADVPQTAAGGRSLGKQVAEAIEPPIAPQAATQPPTAPDITQQAMEKVRKAQAEGKQSFEVLTPEERAALASVESTAQPKVLEQQARMDPEGMTMPADKVVNDTSIENIAGMVARGDADEAAEHMSKLKPELDPNEVAHNVQTQASKMAAKGPRRDISDTLDAPLKAAELPETPLEKRIRETREAAVEAAEKEQQGELIESGMEASERTIEADAVGLSVQDVSNDLDRIIRQGAVLRSVDDEVERSMSSNFGVRSEGVLDKIKDKATEQFHAIRHKRPELREHPDIADVLRVQDNVHDYSLVQAKDTINNITSGLDDNQHVTFGRYLMLEDALRDIDRGVRDPDSINGIPFGYKSVEDLRRDFDNAQAMVANDKALLASLGRRTKYVQQVKEMLVEHDLLNEKFLNDDRYYHQQITDMARLKAADRRLSRGRKDLRERKMGYENKRLGLLDEYNTNYVESEFEWLSQALEKLETKRTLDMVKGKADQSSAIKRTLREMLEEAAFTKYGIATDRAAFKTMLKDEGIHPSQYWREIQKRIDQINPRATEQLARQAIPDGVKPWQPKRGSHFYKASVVDGSQIDDIMDTVVEDNLKIDDVVNLLDNAQHEKLMVGSPRETWFVDEGVAQALDNFKVPKDREGLHGLAKFMTSSWKQWTLLNPFRAMKYNWNNMTGDADIVLAYKPKIMKYADEAYRELRHQTKGGAMNPELKEATRLGVVGSGFSIQEVEDISKSGAFKILTGKNDSLPMKYWGKVKEITNLRENVLRYAAYKHFKRELAAGKKGLYAASRKAEIDAITSPPRKAAKLARELVGDYGNVSKSGEYLREHIVPFWSWMEINMPRYARLFKNTKWEGTPGGKGKVAGIAAKNLMLTKAFALFAGVNLYNHTMQADKVQKLSDSQRRQQHLIIGENPDGTIKTLKFQGALADVLAFVGLEDVVQDVKDIKEGQKQTTDIIPEAATATTNKLASAMLPWAKLAAEVGSGRSFYPKVAEFRWDRDEEGDITGLDASTPTRPIRDRGEHVARFASLEMPYKYATGKPTRGIEKDAQSLLFYNSDPAETAYWDIKSKIYDALDDAGVQPPSTSPTDRSNALYYYKKALVYGDKKAADKWLGEYKTLGGTEQGMSRSIALADPLADISKLPPEAEMKLMRSLTKKDKDKIRQAKQWYHRVYKGKGNMPTEPETGSTDPIKSLADKFQQGGMR